MRIWCSVLSGCGLADIKLDLDTSGEIGDTAETGDSQPVNTLPDCGQDLWGVADQQITDLSVVVDLGASYSQEWWPNCSTDARATRNYHLECGEATQLTSYFLGAGYAPDPADYLVSVDSGDIYSWLAAQATVTGVIIISDDYGELAGQAYLCLPPDMDVSATVLRRR